MYSNYFCANHKNQEQVCLIQNHTYMYLWMLQGRSDNSAKIDIATLLHKCTQCQLHVCNQSTYAVMPR